MTLYSPEYAALQSSFHLARPDYGVSGAKYADQIHQMAQQLQTRSILDYGCGKCTLQKAIPFPIQNYDPFISEHSARPEPADIVVCTDVMEHVEADHVGSVLGDIRDLTKKAVFFQIATGPASKVLPDGRNAHITQRTSNWWLEAIINMSFDIKSFMLVQGGFVLVAAPFEGAVSPAAEPNHFISRMGQ
jgi:hypothetical protein